MIPMWKRKVTNPSPNTMLNFTKLLKMFCFSDFYFIWWLTPRKIAAPMNISRRPPARALHWPSEQSLLNPNQPSSNPWRVYPSFSQLRAVVIMQQRPNTLTIILQGTMKQKKLSGNLKVRGFLGDFLVFFISFSISFSGFLSVWETCSQSMLWELMVFYFCYLCYISGIFFNFIK